MTGNTTTSGAEKRSRPEILWLADKPGWAYDSIVQQVGSQLDQYEHVVFYMMDEHSDTEWRWLGWKMEQVDIVIAMHWMYQVQLQNDKSLTVLMITGHRGFDE